MAALGLDLHVTLKSVRGAQGEIRPVLRDIHLTVGLGEMVALIGPSGCGKTSLLRMAAGLDADFTGSRIWHGASAPRLGVVFQEPRLLAWRSVRQNILLAQPSPDPVLADQLLARLDLAAHAEAWPGTLSLGQARRVAIARALAVRPDLLLLDEAFASLDPDNVARIEALLAETWRARPIATLLVTHDRGQAERLAHRVIDLGALSALSPADR